MRKWLFFWLVSTRASPQTQLYMICIPKCHNKRDTILKPWKFYSKIGSNLWGTVFESFLDHFKVRSHVYYQKMTIFLACVSECLAQNSVLYDKYPKVPEQKRYNVKTIQIWFKIGSSVYVRGKKQKNVGNFAFLTL